MQWFLTILFVPPLFFNKLKRVTAAEGLNLACGKRYDRSRARPGKLQFNWKNSERKNYKIKNMQWFLTILFVSPLFFNKLKRVTAAEGLNLACGKRYDRSRARPGKQQFNWKNGERKNYKIKKYAIVSHHSFLCFCSFLINPSGRQQWQG